MVLGYPEWETRTLIKLLLSMTYIFIVFLMWVSPLVHAAIRLMTQYLFLSQYFQCKQADIEWILNKVSKNFRLQIS